MELYSIKDREKIVEIMRLLASRKVQINVKINEEKIPFASSFIKFYPRHGEEKAQNAPDENAELVIENLKPDKGNMLIRSSQGVSVNFIVDGRFFQFKTRYRGVTGEYPYSGIMIDFPGELETQEIRRDERDALKIPEFISVEFKLEGGPEPVKSYELYVINSSRHGLGLLVTEKDFELLEILSQGDTIRDITFFATWTMIKVEGTVRHISRIENGKYKGLYIIGVESNEIIESCMPPE